MQTRHLLGDKTDIDIKAVSRAINQMELINIFLLDANITSDPSTRSPRGASLKYNFNAEILKRKEDNLLLICNFTVSAFRKDQPDNLIMNIGAKFSLEYYIQNPEKLLENDIDNFIKIAPLDTAWPFWREFVQNLTSRMGFPTLTIPILRFEKHTKKPIKSTTPKKRKTKAG